VLEQAAEGKIDILIGTHKLLQNDVKWKDLGLLIVDEEHRFGVRHKERIKAMRADVDILTLTATPIPRTLNMAMSGMRDLSIIATPPARRLAVKTFVREYDSLVVREAILREVLRGGQVYYLYNDVENIQKAADRLAELVPEARIAIGHGQMRERELERVMNDFHHQRFNVLVCTTIIETGIDIPTANTIIIERADHFGLAQLHQLRGRVGRSHHQAYAWLLTPHPKAMTTDAQKRLEAIASLEDLGAGFALATHDLEIRGLANCWAKIRAVQWRPSAFRCIWSCWKMRSMRSKPGESHRWKISPASKQKSNCACLPCCRMILFPTSIPASLSTSALPVRRVKMSSMRLKWN
jgi:transcription-repair coupling factor (superfamily II helicase)